MNIEKIMKENKCIIIDVRTLGGHVAGSRNIPLQDIPQRIGDLKKLNAPLVLCCASGNRSRQAFMYLNQIGIECYNGGSWLDVNYYQSQTV
jgi:rhodanese-related sulfurtransferase